MENVNVAFSIPRELKKRMEKFPEINWSETVRSLIGEKLERLMVLRKMDAMLSKSRLTEEDCIKLGRKVNAGLAKRYEKEIGAGK